jgi:hypothetical protein
VFPRRARHHQTSGNERSSRTLTRSSTA